MPIVREIIYGAAREGANFEELLYACGFTHSDLLKSDAYVEFEKAQNVWKESVRSTGDRLLGLHLGCGVSPNMIGLTGHLMQTSPTLKEALENVCQFNELFTDMFFYSLEEKRDGIYFGIEPAAGWVNRFPDTAMQARDQAASGVLNVCKRLVGSNVRADKVKIRDRSSGHFTEYEKVLGCPVSFGSRVNAVVFSKATLDHQVSSRDATLYQVFSQMLLKQQQLARKKMTFSQLVRARMEQIFGAAAPSLHEIAFQFNMTSRTFQRKLAEESTTYREIVESYRSHIATLLLKGPDASIKSVSDMLGYSDASTFRRAFKKWLNENPKSYRSRNR